MSETSNQQFTCTHCGATANKRTGKPFNEQARRAHLKACPKRGNPAGFLPQALPQENLDQSLPQEVNEINAGSAGTPTSLSSSLEEVGGAVSSTAPADKEEKREGNVRALWREHKYCREGKRRVFSHRDVGMMTVYLRKGWRRLTEDERPFYQGLVASLYSDLEQHETDDKEINMEKTRQEVQDAFDAEWKERLRRHFNPTPEEIAAWNESCDRLKIEEKDDGTKPILPAKPKSKGDDDDEFMAPPKKSVSNRPPKATELKDLPKIPVRHLRGRPGQERGPRRVVRARQLVEDVPR